MYTYTHSSKISMILKKNTFYLARIHLIDQTCSKEISPFKMNSVLLNFIKNQQRIMKKLSWFA